MALCKWAVLVRGPPNDAALEFLHEQHDGHADEWTIDDKIYFCYSKADCILDAYGDVKILRELGWRDVRVEPID